MVNPAAYEPAMSTTAVVSSASTRAAVVPSSLCNSANEINVPFTFNACSQPAPIPIAVSTTVASFVVPLMFKPYRLSASPVAAEVTSTLIPETTSPSASSPSVTFTSWTDPASVTVDVQPCVFVQLNPVA